MSDKKYWQSFSELNGDPAFKKAQNDEFREELPFEDLDGKGWLDAKSPRRDFLKYLGFSTAAATLAASCETPVRKAIPYVNKPENVVPGIAKYYATTFVQDGEVVPAVAKVRDGRPIKIEGNDLSSLTKGGTSPRMQASVLDLYDTHRNRFPIRRSGKKVDEIPTYQQLDTMIGNALANVGGPVVLLTSTIVSPSTRQIITDFLGRYAGSRHIEYDAVSYSGMLLANQASFGKKAIPAYQFDKARVIVSIGADFLGTWVSPVEFARQYSYGRKINEHNPTMSKHYQLESFLSMTGANADERFVHRPSETGAVAMALLNALGGQAPAVNFPDAKLKNGIQKIAADLKAHAGSALVVCGSNDPNVQQVVNAINSAIGAYGSTINWSSPVMTRQGVDADMVNLVNSMNAGQVGALLIYGANPAYDYHNAEAFIKGLERVKLSVSFNEKMDETSERCHFVIPSHHYLESWGDAESRPGYISFIQPTINPLFKTRQFQTSLLKWSGNNTDYETYFRQYWTGKVGGQQAFEKALQDGVLETAGGRTAGTTSTANNGSGTHATNQTDSLTTPIVVTTTNTGGGGSFNGGGLSGAVTALTNGRKGSKNEIVLYQNVAMATGKQSGNPWLLELPDPVSKSTWENFAMISVQKAKELDIDLDTDYEYYPQKPVIKLTANNKSVELPVLVMPGMQADTIAVAVGYGRSEAYGKASLNMGKNVFGFARFNGTTVDYYNDVAVAEPSGKQKIAQTQIHNSYEERFEVVRETTLASFKQNPDEFKSFRDELTKDYARKTGDYRKEATLYGDHVQPGLKWGMSIDLNSCIGCGACVVACNAENNVPVVGKKEVLRYHDMHWLRIDRYFVSDRENPDDLKAVVFQPMLCQHCDNAPCENVCPVAATMHNSEGLNQMAYNRCIGTRYCANNCPYKVRRFNWADYTGADSFKNDQATLIDEGKLDPVIGQMNDDLTRMVLNPDVVTRSRGVMEKCTFCVQRLQEGKLKAKLQNRAFQDGDVETACQQACPTDAIVFGNVNDQTSRVTQMRKNNEKRTFYVIEQIHTLPNINYLARIRNTDELVKKNSGEGEHARQTDEVTH